MPYNERMMLIQLSTKPINTNLIQVYAPTADSDEETIEKFYSDLNELTKKLKKHELNIIMGDFNAKIGKGKVGNVVGWFGLGDRNERGERLIEFCQEKDLVITNTFYELPPRRLYTWTSPRSSKEKIIKNQIDFICINRRFRNSIGSAKTYPGADADTDHELLVANIKVRLRKLQRIIQRKIINTEKLKELQYQKKFNDSIASDFLETSTTNIDLAWNQIKSTILTAAEQVVGRKEHNSKNPWMTQEIINLIKEKRSYKNTDPQKYKQSKRQIEHHTRKAKEIWMEENCREMEQMNSKQDSFNLHKKLKELTGNTKKRIPVITKNIQGDIQLTEEDKKQTWEEYIKHLFTAERDDVRGENNQTEQLCILKSEVEYAIKTSKSRKATGPDNVPIEFLKALDDRNLTQLTKMLNKIYATGEIPKDWLKSVFIPLPKKNNPKSCDEYRLISLMRHTLKVLLIIIQHRIYRKCEEQLDETQFGFREGLGTREALFTITVLLQKCREYNKDVYVCFIDFKKAFDKVQHDKLIENLKSIKLDPSDIQLIKNIYYNQTAVVRVEDIKTDEAEIQKGVRQGCVLSPQLFNLYSQSVFQKAFYERPEGVNIGGTLINNLRFADDTAIMAERAEDLQTLLERVGRECEEVGLSINTQKTKMMVISKNPNINPILTLNGNRIEQVQKYKYLGSVINSEMAPDQEIKIRIEMARNAFVKYSTMFTNRNLKLDIRLRFMECYVWSVLMYGVETWTLKAQMIKKLEAFEMWLYRRILKIPWTDRITNDEVLRRIGRKRKLLTIIKIGKTSYMGHILRNDKYLLLQNIMQGRIEGKKGIGRMKKSWLRNIGEWTNLSVGELFHVAKDRETFRNVVANLL